MGIISMYHFRSRKRRNVHFVEFPESESKEWWNPEYKPYQDSEEQDHAQVKRSADRKVEASVVHYLDTGRWYLSIYNDDPMDNHVVLQMGKAENSPHCLNDCSNHGVCNWGTCECNSGYDGTDCSRSKSQIKSCSLFLIKHILSLFGSKKYAKDA